LAIILNHTGRTHSANNKVSPGNTSQLENEIDQLVYKLYSLTPEEIKIIESSVK